MQGMQSFPTTHAFRLPCLRQPVTSLIFHFREVRRQPSRLPNCCRQTSALKFSEGQIMELHGIDLVIQRRLWCNVSHTAKKRHDVKHLFTAIKLGAHCVSSAASHSILSTIFTLVRLSDHILLSFFVSFETRVGDDNIYKHKRHPSPRLFSKRIQAHSLRTYSQTFIASRVMITARALTHSLTAG